MARWRLTAKHYLPVAGTEYEYKETNRDTGRQVRKVFEVPLYLDPDQPSDWTDRVNGEIIVSNGEGAERSDIIFQGNPTPDMEPLDDEAEAISAALRQKWEHPIESLPANGGMNENEKAFMENMMAAFAKASGEPTAVSAKGVDNDRLVKLEEQLAALAEQNAKLQAQLAEAPIKERRV